MLVQVGDNGETMGWTMGGHHKAGEREAWSQDGQGVLTGGRLEKSEVSGMT